MKIKSSLLRLLKSILVDKRSLADVCEKYPYLSFDIFDTLITRKCGSPGKIYSLVEQVYNGSQNSSIKGFVKARMNAEKIVRQNSSKEEVTLDEIYDFIEPIYGKERSSQLKEIEISVELEQCVGIEKNILVYNNLAKNPAKKVFVTSDMYLPMSVIVKILKKNGVVTPAKLYVSSEEQLTKRKGTLYKKLLQENHICKHKLLHIGDNVKSDYFRARLNGVHAFLIV